MLRSGPSLLLLVLTLLVAAALVPGAPTGLLLASSVLVSVLLLLESLRVDLLVAALFSAVVATGLYVVGLT